MSGAQETRAATLPGMTAPRRPLIGVTASARGGRWMWGLSWLALTLLGARAERLTPPLDPAALARFDGFVIGGGDDIAAELYGAEPVLDVRIDRARDEMELQALDVAIPRDLPVLGICRGAQMLNIHRGGGLHQELSEVFADLPRFRTPLPVKTVTVEPGSRLAAILGVGKLRANSLHHQAVDQLGEGLRVAGRDEWGVIQAIEDPSARFRIGVQWHPEFLLWRPLHRRLFRALVAAAAARVAARGARRDGETDPIPEPDPEEIHARAEARARALDAALDAAL